MNTDKDDDLYTLKELIIKLLGIIDGLDCDYPLNHPKLYLTLCLEIQGIKVKMYQMEKCYDNLLMLQLKK